MKRGLDNENDKTTVWVVSLVKNLSRNTLKSPHDMVVSSLHQFYECFGDTDHKYLTKQAKVIVLAKTHRIVLHFPMFHNDRDTYIDKMKNSKTFGRFFNTIWAILAFDGMQAQISKCQLILHDKKGRRQEFFLTGRTNPKGANHGYDFLPDYD